MKANNTTIVSVAKIGGRECGRVHYFKFQVNYMIYIGTSASEQYNLKVIVVRLIPGLRTYHMTRPQTVAYSYYFSGVCVTLYLYSLL
jgi:hypothetical protein